MLTACLCGFVIPPQARPLALTDSSMKKHVGATPGATSAPPAAPQHNPDTENVFTTDGFFLFYVTSAQLWRRTTQQTLQHYSCSVIYLIDILPYQYIYHRDVSCKQVHHIHASLSCLCILRKESTTVSPACGNQALLDLPGLSWPCLPSK